MTDVELMLLLAEHTRNSVTLYHSHLSDSECVVMGLERHREGSACVSMEWYTEHHDGWCIV